MGSKVCLRDKSDVLNYVRSISNDVMINDLIFDLINRDGVTNFFYNDDGSYCFYLTTDSKERVYILLNHDHIHILNNLDDIRQQVYYKFDDDGKYICINNFSSIVSHDNRIDRTVKFEKRYDCHENMIFESKVVEVNDLNGDNSCSIISKYVVDGVLVRINSVSYGNNHDMDRVDYYVHEDSCWVNIGVDEFNDRFVEKNSEKVLQKGKSVI
jgi:hypothetical protein